MGNVILMMSIITISFRFSMFYPTILAIRIARNRLRMRAITLPVHTGSHLMKVKRIIINNAVIGVVISAPRPLEAIKTVIMIIAVIMKLRNMADWDTLMPKADATWLNQFSQIIEI